MNRYRSEETMPGQGDRHGPDRWDDEPLGTPSVEEKESIGECWFCHSDATVIHYEPRQTAFYVLCESCGAHGPVIWPEKYADDDKAKDAAIEAWNRRAGDE